MKQAKGLVCIVAIAYGLLVLTVLFKPDTEFSASERRKLAQSPVFSMKAIENGSFMQKTEEYVTDQFPFRDTFRSIKAMFSKNILLSRDTNGIYYKNGFLAKVEYPLNEESIERATSIFQKIYDTHLAGTNVKPYICVIPDKNYVLAESSHLSMDYDVFFQKVKEDLPLFDEIAIKEEIQLSDFYQTDTHWKQEEIIDIAQMLATQMGAPFSGDFTFQELETPFYGVYYGQAALPVKPDQITYCSNEILDACTVFDYENNKEIPLYDLGKATGRDPYELFMGGNVSLVTIESKMAASSKELVVFGDSFSRSILPLLAESYAKITLADIRYMPSAMIGNYITFSNQDVLFLYSTSVLNNSITLK